MEKPAIKIILIFLLLLILISCYHTKDNVMEDNKGLYIRYRYTAEVVYQDVVVEDGKLKYTYFEDREGKCAHWIQQSPCWTMSDLGTVEAELSGEEIQKLVDLLDEVKVFEMDSTYGGAGEGQRFYPYTLEVKEGEKEKRIVYQSFPGEGEMPEGFEKILSELKGLLKEQFDL